MPIRSAFLTALGACAAVAVAVPAAAPAAEIPAPTPGVTARQVGDVVTITFDAAALAAAHLRTGDQLAGGCSVVAPPSTLLAAHDEDDDDPEFGVGAAKLRADGTLVLDLGEYADKDDPALGPLDACAVSRFDKKTGTNTAVAKVALTPNGTARIEDDNAAAALKAALLGAQTPTGGYRAAAAVPGVVALAAPDVLPAAPGQIGYWTDGTRATVVTITPSLRRVFVSDEGHLTARFNLVQQADTLFYSALDHVLDGVLTRRRDPESDGSDAPYGEDSDPQLRADGVRLSRSGRRVTVRFTGRSAKAYKKIAHRKVRVSCVAPAAERLLLPTQTAAMLPKAATAVVRVPRHGGKFTATLSRAPGGVCLVSDDGALVALAGLDTTGRRWLQDSDALDVIGSEDDLRPVAPGGRAYRTAAQIAAQDPKHVVALRSPGAVPPVGRLGVWSDGAQRYEVVAISPTGRRFVIEDQTGGVVRTNVLPAIVAQQETLFAGFAAGIS